MRHPKERLGMVLGVAILPLVLLFGFLLPARRHNQALRETLDALNQEATPAPRFMPLTQAESPLLADPQAGWRRRIPGVQGDRARLDHYTRVVSSLQDALQKAGVPSPSMRSSWDPIHASFTLAGGLIDSPAPSAGPGADRPDLQVKGWILEVQVPGETGNLFRALQASARVEPLLEPVGFRWELGAAERRQHLIFRNLVLVSNTP